MELFDWVSMGIKIAVVVGALMTLVPFMVWVERRGAALLQNRLGPNRVGPLGLLQPVVDAVKLIWKEDPIPLHVSRFYYVIAPLVLLIPALMTFAVIPFAGPIDFNGHLLKFQVADLNVGILYIFAIASLGVYGIIMAGWSSNNKYSLLGSMRSSSQMISYELSLGLSIVGILMVFSTVDLGVIAQSQAAVLFQLGPVVIPKWGIFIQPLGFLIFLTAAFAETNRLPFDLPEGESEIVAGYHLEYGSMKFAIFMLSEYLNMATASGLIVTLFFGGWQMLPGFHWLHETLALSGVAHLWMRVALEVISFSIKLGFFMWFFIWVRWTLPRFRYDQLMDFGWKVMLPLSLINIFVTGVFIYYQVI